MGRAAGWDGTGSRVKASREGSIIIVSSPLVCTHPFCNSHLQFPARDPQFHEVVVKATPRAVVKTIRWTPERARIETLGTILD